MNENGSAGLCGCYQRNTDKVGSEARPGCIGDGHDGTIHEGFHLITLLCRNMQVAALLFHFYAQAFKYFGNHSQFLKVYIPDRYFRLGHGRQTNKASDFNHVGQHGVLATAKGIYTMNC